MKMAKHISCVMVAGFLLLGGFVSQSHAAETFKITVYGNNESGFHDKDGEALNNSVWKVAKGTQVEITFKFDGDMDPAEEEEHEVHMQLLEKADGEKPDQKTIVQRLKPISPTNLESVIKFTAGEFSEKILKLYCKTDCDGMDYMDNLRIEVE